MSRFDDNSMMVGVDYRDPAFEPQSSFDFDEARHNGEYQAIHHRTAPMDQYASCADDGPFRTEHSDAMMVPQDDMFPGIDDSWDVNNISVNGGSRDSNRDFNTRAIFNNHSSNIFAERVGAPMSSQSAIVKARADRVDEHYGNLTPPEEPIMISRVDKTSYSRQSPPEIITKKPSMNRTERARNAAIQRHAKTKRQTVRESLHSETDSEDSNGEADHKREKYREKNRAAAAKCRAKKKNHVEKIEQDARSLETENAVLKARVRELRNQHAELRDLALQHNPSVATCRCGSLHQYNMSKAAEITSSFNAFANLQCPATGEPQDSRPYVVASPGMLEIDAARPSFADMTLDSHGYGSSSNFAFAGIATPESMQSRNIVENDDRSSYVAGHQLDVGGRSLSRTS